MTIASLQSWVAVDGAAEGLAREDADALLGDAAERVGVPQGPDVRVDGSVARALFVVRAGRSGDELHGFA